MAAPVYTFERNRGSEEPPKQAPPESPFVELSPVGASAQIDWSTYGFGA
mgnify:CR=1 FL=1